MELTQIFLQNLLSPAILFFAVGILAGVLKSDLAVPESISRYLSIYLMMAIGFKGGVALANTTVFSYEMILAVLAGISFSFLQPFIGFYLLKLTTKLDAKTAAAIAAHYGSVSIVTFATAVSFLKIHDVTYAGYIVAIVALMEGPAIFSGLFIARRAGAPATSSGDKAMIAPQESNGKLFREVFSNGTILLLAGSFLVGLLSGQSGYNKVEDFLVKPFQGILCMFLLDMGLLVAKQMGNLKKFTFPLIAFGIYMPLLNGALGLAMSMAIGLDMGTGLLLTLLFASASYIAVPAALRLALPEVSPAIYLPMTLAITFPFNIIIGIPLFYALAKIVLVTP
jgi:hypothetical protein